MPPIKNSNGRMADQPSLITSDAGIATYIGRLTRTVDIDIVPNDQYE